MPALVEYIRMAEEDGDARKAADLRTQWAQATSLHMIECADCTRARAIELAYRCLYCGLWFCAACGEHHFGQTIKDYRAKTRPKPTCTGD